MPVYQCFVPPGVMSESLRPQIAEEITRLHIEATGAPRAFVHVNFLDLPAGAHFSAGTLDPHITFIHGLIRAGRPLEVRQKLAKKISAAWSRLTGQPEKQLVLNLTDIDPSTVMEYGLILPRPGAEAEWFKTNREALGGIEGTGI
jgi:phenylpyruvate tautomerase PptA (4-oxalocrotonate tautomerase family)